MSTHTSKQVHARVNVVRLGDRCLALTETPLPVEFDEHTLETKGLVKEDMIIRGGHNVSPRVVAELLDKYPAVRGAAPVGVRDSARGEEAGAASALKPEAATTSPSSRVAVSPRPDSC